jgi:hypothetical protein
VDDRHASALIEGTDWDFFFGSYAELTSLAICSASATRASTTIDGGRRPERRLR